MRGRTTQFQLPTQTLDRVISQSASSRLTYGLWALISICVVSVCLLAGSMSIAHAQSFNAEQIEKLNANSAEANNPLTHLDDDFANDIKLLDNRFRIDHEVDEVTMVFFREFGSAPVVLVKPDGSKIFQYTAVGKQVTWFDSPTYDMINIKKPMAGPWQALGSILDNSRIMVISNLALVTNPLPDELFSGEILKMTSYLLNDGKPMTFAPFAEAIRLTVNLISTNNPAENNFGARPMTIAVFEDNGLGFDEKPKDGIFTGQFRLEVPDGEWQSVSKIATPMYSREKIDPKLRVYPTPIEFELTPDLSETADGQHIVTFKQKYKKFDPTSLLIDGQVRLPDGTATDFSLNRQTLRDQKLAIDNVAPGVYRVTAMAYARTLTGRDVVINLPEYSFTIEPVVIVPPPPTPEELELMRLEREEAQRVEKELADKALLKKALIINGFILFAGIVIMVAIRLYLNYEARPKPKPKEPIPDAESGEEESVADLPLKDKIIMKIKSFIPSKKKDDIVTDETALEAVD